MKVVGWGMIAGLFLLACKYPRNLESKMLKINWDTLAVIPPAAGTDVQYGLAGPVSGVFRDVLFVGGGSNFEDAMPWEGGEKRYHDDIYLLKQDKNDEVHWTQSERKLPFPMAYSACLSIPEGIVSMGGESGQGPVPNVFLLSVDDDLLRIEDWPDLPVPLTSAGAARIESTIYLAGGLTFSGATRNFFAMDLERPEAGWQVLPDLPIALSHAVVAAQSDGTEICIYVLGGRNKSGITSSFLSDIWKYSPSAKIWQKAGKLKLARQSVFGLSAGTGLAYGDHAILIFGGDKGAVFNETERLTNAAGKTKSVGKREKLQQQKIKNLTNHPGFCRDVYLFDTLTGVLSLVGEIEGMAQVTTNAFWWNRQIIIPGGEIRPGVRTDKISRGIIVPDKQVNENFK